MALIAISSVAMAQVDSTNKVQGPATDTPPSLYSTAGTSTPVHPVLAELDLPNAPSAMKTTPAAEQPFDKTGATRPSPVMGAGVGRTFWIANSVMMGSSLVNAELIARCPASRCLSVPDAIRSRAALYGIAVPASAAITYIAYRLKKSGNKWWYLPVAAVTGANVVYAAHAAPYAH